MAERTREEGEVIGSIPVVPTEMDATRAMFSADFIRPASIFTSPFSSVEERLSYKEHVGSSILSGGTVPAVRSSQREAQRQG